MYLGVIEDWSRLVHFMDTSLMLVFSTYYNPLHPDSSVHSL